MSPAALAGIAGCAFVVSWAATKGLLPILRHYTLDRPNPRSSHTVPTPRSGGLGILCGIVAGHVVARAVGLPLPRAEILIGGATMAAVGLLDDWSGLRASARFILQLAAAAVVVSAAEPLVRFPLPPPLDIPLGQLGRPLAVFWVVGITNVYNFLDGIDGYAATQGVVAGLAIAFLDTSGPLATVGLAIAGACAGFLLLNWHPARVFMGDVGSATLGFCIAAAPLNLGGESQVRAVFLVAIALWFFFADGLFTFVHRLLRGERVWEAHRTHLYQRLVTSGLRHDRVVLPTQAANATLSAAALVGLASSHATAAMWAVSVCAVALFGAMVAWTARREHLAHPRNRAGG